MKTSIRHRLMRLGIICGATGAFLAALIGISYILTIEKDFSDELGLSVVSSVSSSMQEEMTFLANGLRDSVSGENNDIFNNVFLMGEVQRYDYTAFEKKCANLPVDGVMVNYIPAGRCYLFALRRENDTIVGELRDGYFDYVTDTMSGEHRYGFFIDDRTGEVLVASEKGKCGTNLTGVEMYEESLAAFASDTDTVSGNMFSDHVVYSSSLPTNSEFGAPISSVPATPALLRRPAKPRRRLKKPISKKRRSTFQMWLSSRCLRIRSILRHSRSPISTP